MFTPESAKLKILPGNIYSEDHAIIYEVDKTLQKVVLPFESQTVLELLMEKDRSISELVNEIKERNQGFVSYKNLFFTTDRLLREGIVYQADSESPPYYDDSKLRLINNLTMDLVVSPKIMSPQMVRQNFFYAFSMAIILGGLYGLHCLVEQGFSDDFLLIRGRYDSGFFFALVFFSIMMSFKSLILVALNLTCWGRVYDVSIRISPLSCALRLDDTLLYATSRKFISFLYGTASALSYFFIAGISQLWITGPTASAHLYTMAALLTLLDLSPINGGELRKFARSLVTEEENDHLRPFYETQMIRSIFRFRGINKAFLIYSLLVVVFCFAGMATLFYLLNENAPNLIDQLMNPDTAQRTGAGIVLVLIVVPFIYLATDFMNSIFKNLTGMSYGMVAHIKNRFGSKVLRLLDRNRLKDLIRSTPLFAAVQDNVLDYIMDSGVVVSYKEGTPIIQQGKKGTEIYLVLTGSVIVQRRDNTGYVRKLTEMGAGCVFGEMAVYGMDERTADVIAKERVQAFVIRAEALLDLSRSADYQVQMQYVMDRIMITQYFMSQPFFSSLPVELIQVFYSHGVVEEVDANKLVIQQGQKAEDFFLILRGSAFVEVNGQTVNTLNQGEFFGEIALLMDSRRTASIRTVVDSTLLRIPSHIFWKLALSNLEVAAYFEAIAEQRMEELKAPLVQAMTEAREASLEPHEQSTEDTPKEEQMTAENQEKSAEKPTGRDEKSEPTFEELMVAETMAEARSAAAEQKSEQLNEIQEEDTLNEVMPTAVVSESSQGSDDSGDNSGTPAA